MAPLPEPIQRKIEETERRVRALASYADLEVSTETIPWMLSKLGEGGTNVSMSATGFSSFERTLGVADIGVTLPVEARRYVSGIKIKNCPPEYIGGFTSAQATAYDSVRGSAYPLDLTTAYNGSSWRYCTWSMWPRLEQMVKHSAEQKKKAAEKLLADKDKARVEYERIMVGIAEDALERLQKQLGSDFRDDPTFFKTRIISNGLAEFDKLVASIPNIGFRLRARPIILGVEILEAQARESELEAALTAAQAGARFAEEQRRIELRAKEQEERIRLASVQRNLERDADVKERIRQVQLQTAREEAEEMLNPFKQGFALLRARVYDDLVGIRDNLAKSGTLAPATSQKLASILDTFRSMKMSDDEELELLIERVSLMAQTTGVMRDRSAPQVLGLINQVIAVTEAEAEEVKKGSRASRIAF